MTRDTFKMIHSELIQQVQCIEHDLKVMYAGGFLLRLWSCVAFFFIDFNVRLFSHVSWLVLFTCKNSINIFCPRRGGLCRQVDPCAGI